MNPSHDPIRQTNYLRQLLSQEKRPLGLFLSAGCPMAVQTIHEGKQSALIPGIDGITEIVLERMDETELKEVLKTILTHFSIDERNDPTIEDLLTHVRSLRTVAGNEKVRGLTADDLDKVDHKVCEVVVEVVNKSLPDRGTPYGKVAAWIGAIPRTHAVEIFTPNYDLLMEQALEDNRVPYFDGFIGSRHAFFDSYAMEEDVLPSRWARLWKLHGSINWRQNEVGHVFRGRNVVGTGRRVIHPSHLKYEESRQMPYLAMIDRLHAFLKRSAAVLVICGYSFRDDHINASLLRGLRGNATAAIFALLYGKLASHNTAIQLASTVGNLSLLAEDGAVIGTQQSTWRAQGPEETGGASRVAGSRAGTEREEGMPAAGFDLGDFVRFGRFLGDLIGTEDRNRED